MQHLSGCNRSIVLLGWHMNFLLHLKTNTWNMDDGRFYHMVHF